MKHRRREGGLDPPINEEDVRDPKWKHKGPQGADGEISHNKFKAVGRSKLENQKGRVVPDEDCKLHHISAIEFY